MSDQLPPHLRPPKRSRAPLFLGIGVVAVVVAAFLAFGVFGVHTAFIDEEVSAEDPFATNESDGGGNDGAAADDGADQQPRDSGKSNPIHFGVAQRGSGSQPGQHHGDQRGRQEHRGHRETKPPVMQRLPRFTRFLTQNGRSWSNFPSARLPSR